MKLLIILLILVSTQLLAKEIALTFDDAPGNNSPFFESKQRTETLITKLNNLKVKGAMIFANPCKDSKDGVKQLKKYVDSGHFIGNHTCWHVKLDEVGLKKYTKDTLAAEEMLTPLIKGQKFFRYPYLNEGSDPKLRDQMREWLKEHGYRNGMVSVDDDEYLFSWRLNQARDAKKNIDYPKLEKLFVDYLIGAAEYYDSAAVKYLGYSPKHVMLLHEVDATVMFVDALVKELRKRGWKIISAADAYQDKIYFNRPQNTYESNGIIAQTILEKTGKKVAYKDPSEIDAELKKLLGLQ